MVRLEAKRFRSAYTGEKITTSHVYANQQWNDETEWVPNAVVNDQTSNQAVVIGNGLSRLEFNLDKIKNHRGGLLGSLRLQSYGCNALYKDFTPDFLVATNEMVDEIAKTNFTNDNIVYTHPAEVLDNPGKFYMIPNDPYTDAGTTAVYLAAFDGHRKVFMLGFDGQDTPGVNNNVYAGHPNYSIRAHSANEYQWHRDLKTIMSVYDGTEFIKVSRYGTDKTPDSWKSLSNFRQVSFYDFAKEADL